MHVTVDRDGYYKFLIKIVWRLQFSILVVLLQMKRKLSSVETEWFDEVSSGLLLGSLSGCKLHRLVHRAQAAGAKGAEQLAKAGSNGKFQGNINRDMMRALRKNSDWPRLYYADIPLWDSTLQKPVQRAHPFLLPHEWLAKANSLGDLSSLHGCPLQHVAIYQHMKNVAAGLNSPLEHIPMGLHFDGVPFGSQVFYSDSLELFSLNFPVSADYTVRVPFTSIQKKHMIKHETYQSILSVLAWSLKLLALGVFPNQRHDGSFWGMGEKQYREHFYKNHQPVKALLCEIRADWVALFQFPQQNENSGICWMCHARPADIRDCSVQASWRSNRRTAMSFHAELKRTGKSCPLWSVPGVNSDIVMVDWLHACDLGVTADVLGNVLLELVDTIPGQDRQSRMACIWKDISEAYRANNIEYSMRFPSIQMKSFLQTGKSPKLKGKASHIRALVPIMLGVAEKHWPDPDFHTQTVKSCLGYLCRCYEELSDFSSARFEEAATRMAILYCTLEKEQLQSGVEKRWKVKPKLHMFMELAVHLCSEKKRGNPRNFWTYADETNGGHMKEIAKSHGGKNSSSSSCYRLLIRFVSQSRLPGQV